MAFLRFEKTKVVVSVLGYGVAFLRNTPTSATDIAEGAAGVVDYYGHVLRTIEDTTRVDADTRQIWQKFNWCGYLFWPRRPYNFEI